MIPGIEFLIIALAAFRITHFFVYDTLMGASPDSGSSFSMWLDRFAYDAEGYDRSWLRGKVGDLLTCPWCLGWHISWMVYAAWVIAAGYDDIPLAIHVLTTFAVAGLAAFVERWVQSSV